MHQRLINDHGLVVTRDTVHQVLKILDPEGVDLRSKHRLRRRTYNAKGPNYLWHIDGYDKLKLFILIYLKLLRPLTLSSETG